MGVAAAADAVAGDRGSGGGVSVIGRRARRVRIHLFDQHPQLGSPSIEGVLVRRLGREFHVALPELVAAPGRDNILLDEARILAVPRENVAFYEVLR